MKKFSIYSASKNIFLRIEYSSETLERKSPPLDSSDSSHIKFIKEDDCHFSLNIPAVRGRGRVAIILFLVAACGNQQIDF